MAFAAPSIKGRALRYLSQREHSRAELERKLKRWSEGGVGAALSSLALATPDDATATDDPTATATATATQPSLAQQIAAALDDLVAKGFLSDARAAESVLNRKGSRLGVHRLRQELRAKGLGAELVNNTLAKAKATEFERARDLWLRRFGSANLEASEAASESTPDRQLIAKRRAQQMRFLAARGFSGDVIRRVMQAATHGADDADDADGADGVDDIDGSDSADSAGNELQGALHRETSGEDFYAS